MKKRKRESFSEKYGVRDIFVRRIVFASCMLPAVINLFLFSIFISEGRSFVLGCAAAFTVYFLITFFFDIKTERWTVFTLMAVAALSILISLFFILAYKLYAFLLLLVAEITFSMLAVIFRNTLRGFKKEN